MVKQKEQLYWAGIEYLYDKAHPQYLELRGGFVYVFFKTADVRTFLEAIQSAFVEECLIINKVEHVSIYDKNMMWEKPEDTKKFNQLIKEAELTKNVVFDDFYAYQR